MAAKKKVETCSINSLPDEVLGQILSLFPTKLAAATSVLSKRWRNLLPLVQNLDFDESMVFYPNRTSETIVDGGGFLDFVDRTLVLLGDSPIKKFSMKWDSQIDNSQYNHLIRNVLERGALELDLSSTSIQRIMPEFFSKTLVKLTLSRGHYEQDSHPPNGVLFPALKTLSLVQVSYNSFGWGDLYDCLLDSCPVLEEVNIFSGDPFDGGGWRKHIWGSSIQRISIFYRFHALDAHLLVGLDTPSLVYLEYSSYVAEDYQYEYFGYDSTKGDAWGDATKLVEAIRNVVTLHLSADSLEVFHCCCKSMPEFNNLVTLSFESHEERDWQVLPLLLQKSPNLETLVLKGLVHKFTKGCGDVCACKRARKKRKKKISCLLSCGVKVLKVYGYGGSCRELKQMRHFMENLRCLEVVKVKVEVDKQDKKYADDLMKLLQTASSKCKIQFI
ncbi:PREDICTED: F-box/LRR-repeat protein At2g29930-like [Camelina sativa]|uniref:F-box/LRR-repeat protein At2g29930-like n=1 Tax=Camelina sativa TaxID=90675 RepID=A0ABM1QC95_CAMSA|nr:PREDICTED: F-box/LRR-repeat protein At2g29930-like [Camelina sativa]